MSIARAALSTYRQSPRKVRLVADLVRGKSVPAALTALAFLSKRASAPVAKLINSAAANARERLKLAPEALVIHSIAVDTARTAKRFRPRAFGRAARVKKRSSHVTVILAEKK